MKKICVFCGSAKGLRPGYSAAMSRMAQIMLERDLELIYGGGRVGLMGAIADAMLAQGGKVIGIIPQSIAHKEVAHPDLTELHVVKDMHERKALMAHLSDAFIAAPGGMGTLEETFEVWTWGQLGLHTKPLGVFNIDDYYTPLLTFLDHVHHEGFVSLRHRHLAVVDSDPAALLDKLNLFEHPGSVFSAP